MSSSEIVWPTQRDENWRYTSLKTFLKTAYHPLSGPSYSDDLKIPKDIKNLLSPDESVVVFYNGQLVERLCEKLNAVQFMSSREALKTLALTEDVKEKLVSSAHHTLQPFSALNEKMTAEPYLLKLAANDKAHKIHFVYLYGNLHNQKTEPFVSYYKNLVLLDPGAQAEVVESHFAVNNIQFHVNGATDYLLGANSQLTHVKQSWLGDYAVGVYESYFELKKDSRLKTLNSTITGALVRNEIAAHMIEEGCEAQIDGIYLGREKDHIDNSTLLYHHVGHTKSDQLYKGILSGNSRAVFNGKLIIALDAQKSDAAQLNQTLLVSDYAEMDTKPALEVYADDVKAAHGASIGRLSDDEMFYLQSRAISKEKAFEMLAKGFVAEVLTRLDNPTLATKARSLIERAMPSLLDQGAQ
jgi:Fe-S cluster assembly protein SufD